MSQKILCSFFICLFFSSALKAQKADISIEFQNISLESALNQLITNQQVALSFNPELLPDNIRINKKFIHASVQNVLEYLLAGTGLTYKFSGNEYIIVTDKIKSITLSGRVKDLVSGENVIGCSIYIKSLNKGIATNNYGYYSLSVPPGDYIFLFSHIGYKKKALSLSLNTSRVVDIQIEKQIDTLKEVEVKEPDESDSLLSTTQGKSIPIDFEKRHLSLGGEADAVKSLQMQSGILGITEGSSSLFIRGGNKDQNLILLDEAPIYNPAHLFGLVSILNPDAISHIQVYKDEIPANFGGRLSSVIDNRMDEGNNRQFHIKGGVSFLSARLAAEGPIVQNKASFLITFRRGLTDFVNNNFQLLSLRATYYDINLKLNYNINSNNRLYYSSYYGFDDMSSLNTYKNTWGNKASTIRWNHIFNSRLFSNISAIYSNYTNSLDIDADQFTNKYRWETGIKDLTLKGDFTFYYKPESNIKFGFSGTQHKFIPGESTSRANDSIPVNIPREKANEFAAYLSHQFFVGDRIQVTYGLRSSIFRNSKVIPIDSATAERGITFVNFEPRLFIQYKLSAFQRLHFTYNRNYQYLQLIQNDELAYSSLESWIPSSVAIAPQKADFYSTGYKNNFRGLLLEISTYYKKMLNQPDLIDHAQIILNPLIETQLRSGRSDAYGTEFTLSKNESNLNFNLNYTWSNVNKKINSINNNKVYPANYNIPHDFKLAVTYRITHRLYVNSFFNYKTGRPVTLPVGYYIQNNTDVPIFEDRNRSRFPDYSRLDLSVELKANSHPQNKHYWQSDWIVAVYNVYNKRNPLFYGINQSSSTNNIGSGITPSLTYNFKF